ncbi:MAG: hypothetical protein ACTHLJ_12625 [Angustibacter sp.]
MTASPRGQTTAAPDALPTSSLAPVREAMLAHAHAESDAVVRQARHDADELIARARAEAQELAEQAAHEGEADAAAALASEQAGARRRARGVVLGAQAQVVEALRERVRSQVAGLADDPDWPRHQDALARAAEGALAADAGDTRVERLCDGVRVTSGSRSVTLTLAALADAAVDELGTEVERLWQP